MLGQNPLDPWPPSGRGGQGFSMPFLDQGERLLRHAKANTKIPNIELP